MWIKTQDGRLINLDDVSLLNILEERRGYPEVLSYDVAGSWRGADAGLIRIQSFPTRAEAVACLDALAGLLGAMSVAEAMELGAMCRASGGEVAP